MKNQNSINLKRNSRIELLKIISIILIIFSHSVPFGTINNYVGKLNLNLATTNINNLIMVIMKYGGQIGNAIFVICSSWFLVDNDKIKVKKIFNIIADAVFISILICILFLIFGSYCISLKEIIKMFFPILFKNNWFITCYLLFYIINPALNLIINKLKKKQLLSVNIILIFYLTINTFKQEFLYYNDLIGFIAIYFIISYLKKYMINFVKNVRLNKIIFITSMLSILIGILLINYIGLKINLLNNLLMKFCIFINPVIIIFVISLFNLTISKEKFHNSMINQLSGLSLLIYMIHDNYLIREYLKSSYFTFVYNMYGYKNIILYCILLAVIMTIFSVLGSIIYKIFLQKIVYKISNKIYITLKKIEDRILEKGVA